MNEEPCSEKKLLSVLNAQRSYSEERNKLIFEIHALLDRIVVDKPIALLANKLSQDPGIPVKSPTFLADMNDVTSEMRIANDSLRQVVNRLNELI